jgi:hypothetical protein
MTLIACGRTNVDDRSEAITRAWREDGGFRTDGGCGFVVDTDNPIQLARLYRCVECGRFLCKPCIFTHFKESNHDDMAPRSRSGDRSAGLEDSRRTSGSAPERPNTDRGATPAARQSADVVPSVVVATARPSLTARAAVPGLPALPTPSD